MSRIGKKIIELPAKVSVKVGADGAVNVEGPKGKLSWTLPGGIACKVEGTTITVARSNEDRQTRALHGLSRALINNMIVGVSTGWTKNLEMIGVGYRAKAAGQQLEMTLGFSHPIVFELPTEITVTAKAEKGENPTIILESFDKQLIGQVAAKIRSLRAPEPYKGKGVRYVGEFVRKKAGKSAAK